MQLLCYEPTGFTATGPLLYVRNGTGVTYKVRNFVQKILHIIIKHRTAIKPLCKLYLAPSQRRVQPNFTIVYSILSGTKGKARPGRKRAGAERGPGCGEPPPPGR
eukprot:4253337-Prymnesium_polylepis.2